VFQPLRFGICVLVSSICVPACFSQHLCSSICVRICVAASVFSASVFAFVLQHLCSHLCCSICVLICVAASVFAFVLQHLCSSICVAASVFQHLCSSICVPASVFQLLVFQRLQRLLCVLHKQSIAINDNLNHLLQSSVIAIFPTISPFGIDGNMSFISPPLTSRAKG
jgi:hypothetical protein